MKTKITSEFDSYIKLVYGGLSLPPQQLLELRRAFLAGVNTGFEVTTDAAFNTPDNATEEECNAIISAIPEAVLSLALETCSLKTQQDHHARQN